MAPYGRLGAHLTVYEPGPYRARLRALATFRRTGRLKPGQRRVLRYFRQDAASITLPRGLAPHVVTLTGCPVDDRRLRLAAVDFGWRGELRDYQEAVVQALVAHEGGTIVMLPGGGKTVVALNAVARFQQPALWLTHTLRLAEQARSEALRWLGLSSRTVGYVGEGIWQPGTLLTVAMVQSLAKNPRWTRELARRVGTLVLDEAHHSPAASFMGVIEQFPAAYRIGLSATPDREDGLGPLVVGLMGPRIVVPERVLRQQRRILVPQVVLVPMGWRWRGSHQWAQMEQARARSAARNRQIARLVWRAWRAQRHVLVLVERTDHAALLERLFRAAGLPAQAIIGATPGPQRERAFAAVAAGRVIGIATKLANEGVDLPAVDTLVLAAPGRSGTRLVQQLGRVMRTAPGKQAAVVYDCTDTLIPTYAHQRQARVRLYRERGYPVRRWVWPEARQEIR